MEERWLQREQQKWAAYILGAPIVQKAVDELKEQRGVPFNRQEKELLKDFAHYRQLRIDESYHLKELRLWLGKNDDRTDLNVTKRLRELEHFVQEQTLLEQKYKNLDLQRIPVVNIGPKYEEEPVQIPRLKGINSYWYQQTLRTMPDTEYDYDNIMIAFEELRDKGVVR